MGHAPFRLVGGKDNGPEVRQHGAARRHARPPAATATRCGPRSTRFRRQADTSGAMDGLDAFTQQALGILTSSQAGRRPRPVEGRPEGRRAVRRRRPGVRARRRAADGPQLLHRPPPGRGRRPRRLDELQPLGLARRRRHELRQLASATSRCSTRGLSSLLTDLHDRGLDKDVSVVVWGEFGRTPRLNNTQQPRPLAAGQLRASSPAAA